MKGKSSLLHLLYFPFIAINLQKISLINSFFSKNVLDGKGVFEIRLPTKKVIYLKAPTHAEMVKWVTELNSASRPVLRRRV